MNLINDVTTRILEKLAAGNIGQKASVIQDNTASISSENAMPMRAKLNCDPFNTGAPGRPVSSPGPSCISIIPE